MSVDVKKFGKVAVLMGGQTRTGGAGAPQGGGVTPKRAARRPSEEMASGE